MIMPQWVLTAALVIITLMVLLELARLLFDDKEK